MKKNIHSLAVILALSTGTLHAQVLDQAARSFNELDEKIQQYPFEFNEVASEQIPSFWEIKAEYDRTGHANVYSIPYEGDTVLYSDFEVDVYYNFGIGCHSGIALGAGWNANEIKWNNNPFFHKKHFSNAVFSLSGFTSLVPCWLWKGGFSMNADTDHFNYISHHAIYNLTFWGRYDFWDNLGVHVGLLGQTGIRKDKVQPIIGFDYSWSDDWQLNIIYPVNMSLVYYYSDEWSAMLAARIMEARYRVGEDEPLPMAIWQYQNVGAELGLTYQCGAFAEANIHVGYATGGDLKISDHHDRHAIHVKQNGTYYAGGTIDFKW